MATATAESDIDRAVIDARWTAAMTRPIRYSNEPSITWTVSKRYDRINHAIEELAALLVEDGAWEDEKDGEDDSLDMLMHEVWDEIEARLKAWASPARRSRRHAAIRARKATAA